MPGRILLTGGTGYLGRFLIRELLSDYELSLLSRTRLSGLDLHQIMLPPDDWSDWSCLDEVRRCSPDIIVHAAAMASPYECEVDADTAERVNVLWTEKMVSVSRELGIPIVFISTDLVFDGAKPRSGGFLPQDEPQPCSVYATTKVGSERIVLSYPLGQVVRLSLLYGPPMAHLSGSFGWMVKLFQAGENVDLFEDEWRTPVFVRDATRVIRRLIEHPHGLRIVHLAGDERVTRVQLGTLFANRFGFDSSLICKGKRSDKSFIPPRPEDVSLNNEQMKTALGIDLTRISDALASFELE